MRFNPTKIRQRREDAGLTRAGAADRAGVSFDTVLRLENNRQIPTLETAARLARTYGCRVEDFLDVADLQAKAS